MSQTDTLEIFHVGLLQLEDLDPLRRPMLRVYVGSPLTDVPKRRQKLTVRARDAVKECIIESKHGDFDIYDPSNHTRPGSKHTPDEIYEIDRFQIAVADLFVLCRTSAADGAGIEYSLALNYLVPTLVVHPQKQHISRLLLATPAVHVPPIAFDDISDLRQRLRAEMPKIARIVVQERSRRRRLKASDWASQFRRMIVKLRIRGGISREYLAKACGMSAGMLKQNELYDEVIGGLSNFETQAILHSLDFRSNLQPGNGITFPADDFADQRVASIHPELRFAWKESLESLVDFVLLDMPANDERVRQIWAAHDEMIREVVAGREPLIYPLAVDQWRARYGGRESRGLL